MIDDYGKKNPEQSKQYTDHQHKKYRFGMFILRFPSILSIQPPTVNQIEVAAFIQGWFIGALIGAALGGIFMSTIAS
ncbi:MAG: hypothetical protein A2X93_09355 [Deltaproteobacteria bacterium GWC2_56_8]|nr:MAG: hypothetical protein A2X93_09355 [Deltaproteobacteria bacterium GWC2_56_8]